MSCDDYCTNFGCNSGPGCPVGGACHHMPGCQDAACPGHPGRLNAQGVARIKSSTPKFSDVVPPETGNFQIVDLGPDEVIAPVRALMTWLLVVLAVVVALVLLVSYSTEAHAQALWAFLQGVS